MEVKSIYLDLQKAEPKKRGNKTVRKLESEAFKEPLELKIGYDDKELDEFKWMVKDLKAELEKKDKEILELQRMDADIDHWLKLTQSEMLKDKENVLNCANLIENQSKEISQLYKVIADLKTTIETQSGTIIHLQDKVKELEKKTTKQPSVFTDKTFISGHESCGLTMIEIPSGEYLLISKYEIWECNEFVTNRNDVVMEKITVNDNCYIPMYKLIGGSELDVPTATIYWTLVFIPC